MEPRLASEAEVLGLALTGEQLPIDGALIPGLESLGWDAARLGEVRRSRQAAGQPWPFPVDPALIKPIGFARFDALLATARSELGLDGLSPVKARPGALSADEQRLAAERPPHW